MRLAAGRTVGRARIPGRPCAICATLAAEPANEAARLDASRPRESRRRALLRPAARSPGWRLRRTEESLPDRRASLPPTERDRTGKRASIEWPDQGRQRRGAAGRATREGALFRLRGKRPGSRAELAAAAHRQYRRSCAGIRFDSVGSLGDVKLVAGDREGALCGVRGVPRRSCGSSSPAIRSHARWQARAAASALASSARYASPSGRQCVGALADLQRQALVVARRLAAADPGRLELTA